MCPSAAALAECFERERGIQCSRLFLNRPQRMFVADSFEIDRKTKNGFVLEKARDKDLRSRLGAVEVLLPF